MYGVFVGGLGSSSEQEVREVFEQFGAIDSVKIIREGVGQPKGYGFVNFCSEEAQQKALANREELKINGSTWFVRKGHTSVAKDQLMCLQVTGFPENWNKQKIKNYVTKQTGLEVLNIGQQGLKTCFSFRRSEVQKAVQALNGAQVDGRQITVESATPKVHRQQNITFATVLYELALANGITPLLDQQQFYLLEKSLRTLYVGNIAQEVTELEIASCFRDACAQYGSLEDVSLVLNLETGEHRGFAFVVFDSHKTCEEVLAADKFHSINGNIVKVQSSKPPKAVAELAKQAGLNDMEGHRTPLLEQMLNAARQQVEIMNLQRKAKLMDEIQNSASQQYIHDPTTGQLYLLASAAVPQLNTVGTFPTVNMNMGMPAQQLAQSQFRNPIGYDSEEYGNFLAVGMMAGGLPQQMSYRVPQTNAFNQQLLMQRQMVPQQPTFNPQTVLMPQIMQHIPQPMAMQQAINPALFSFANPSPLVSPKATTPTSPLLLQHQKQTQHQQNQISTQTLANPMPSQQINQNQINQTKSPNLIQPVQQQQRQQLVGHQPALQTKNQYAWNEKSLSSFFQHQQSQMAAQPGLTNPIQSQQQQQQRQQIKLEPVQQLVGQQPQLQTKRFTPY